MENFSVIVEYGGPNASPRYSFPSKLDSFPSFHFIKVELDMPSACGQLCAGVTVPYSLKMIKVRNIQPFLTSYIGRLYITMEESV